MTVYILWLIRYDLLHDDIYSVLGVYSSAAECNLARERHLITVAQAGGDTTFNGYRIDVLDIDNDNF